MVGEGGRARGRGRRDGKGLGSGEVVLGVWPGFSGEHQQPGSWLLWVPLTWQGLQLSQGPALGKLSGGSCCC